MNSYHISNTQLMTDEVTTFQFMGLPEVGIFHNEILKHEPYMKSSSNGSYYKQCFLIEHLSPKIMLYKCGFEELLRSKILTLPSNFTFTDAIIYRCEPPFPGSDVVEFKKTPAGFRYLTLTVILKNSGDLWVEHSVTKKVVKVSTIPGTCVLMHAPGLYGHEKSPAYGVGDIIAEREVIVFRTRL